MNSSVIGQILIKDTKANNVLQPVCNSKQNSSSDLRDYNTNLSN